MRQLNPRRGVCAQVKIRLSQRATVTRTAFEATLEISNGEPVALVNVSTFIIVRGPRPPRPSLPLVWSRFTSYSRRSNSCAMSNHRPQTRHRSLWCPYRYSVDSDLALSSSQALWARVCGTYLLSAVLGTHAHVLAACAYRRLFPLPEAAPTAASVLYTVGGVLSYTLNGVRVTINLTPATIEVYPNPRIFVDYFWPRR